MMASGVKTFLTSIGMERHFPMFETRGFDDEDDIPHLTSSDLACIGIIDPVEIIIILKAAKAYRQSSEYNILRWLREHGLEHYTEGFVQSGLMHLSDVAQLNLPCEELYDELEITLPGHQRRLERAVCILRKKQRGTTTEKEGDEDLVTEGWWGFPTYLPNAKYPFLCVQASLKSTRPLSAPKCIDFMIDSGSDVSTMRDEIIQELNLEAVTTVKSCGAYGSQRTTLYKAYLNIGDCRLEIEVIGSSYDSLGSRVLRHFSHQIDKNRHKWFRVRSSSIHNSTNQRSLDSEEEEVAETVSILPSLARGNVCETDRNSAAGYAKDGNSTSSFDSSKNTRSGGAQSGLRGDGSAALQEALHEGNDPELPVDETDSFGQKNYGCRIQTTVGYGENSKIKHPSHSKPCDRQPFPTTSCSDQTGSSYSQNSLNISQKSSPKIVSLESQYSGVVRILTDDTCAQTFETQQKTPLPQRGCLKLSGDGTLSLTFGNEKGSHGKKNNTNFHTK